MHNHFMSNDEKALYRPELCERRTLENGSDSVSSTTIEQVNSITRLTQMFSHPTKFQSSASMDNAFSIL